jgi:serine/threonine-protein kinase
LSDPSGARALAAEPAAGTLVTPRVRLVRLLRCGAMGSVWIAEHVGLRTHVAVKFLSLDLMMADPTMVDRFIREASLAAQIRHPHVVQMLDHGLTDDGRPFLIMELLEGETLRERLRRGKLEVGDARELVKQVAAALSRAHDLGIVHRDVKPDNLMVGAGAHFKVLDFGVAKRLGAEKADITLGAMVGTPSYMSPEQVTGRTVDLQADLWALAVVAYEALTGRQPFEAASLDALCRAIEDGVFTAPSLLRKDLPDAVDAFFERAFERRRERRFPSAAAMALAFEAALEATATPDRSIVRRIRRRRRGRGLYMAALTTAVVLAGIVMCVLAALEPESSAAAATLPAMPLEHVVAPRDAPEPPQPAVSPDATAEPPARTARKRSPATPGRRELKKKWGF